MVSPVLLPPVEMSYPSLTPFIELADVASWLRQMEPMRSNPHPTEIPCAYDGVKLVTGKPGQFVDVGLKSSCLADRERNPLASESAEVDSGDL